MRPLIEERDGDDAGYVERVRAIVAGVLRDRRVEEAVVVRIDNWFDRKWLEFSGHRSVPYECGPFASRIEEHRRAELTFPPFHPNRVQSWTRYAWNGYAERFVEARGPGSKRPHRLQRSSENLGRRVAQGGSSVAYVWMSGNTSSNGRGSLMVYVAREERTEAWYASLVRDGGWSIAAVAGVSQDEVERFADEGAALERAARERVLPEEEALARELHRAIDAGDLGRVSTLLAGDVDLEGRDAAGRTPLLHAIQELRWDCADFLLSAGANPHQAEHDGWNAIHHCVWADPDDPESERMLHALLARGVAVNARTSGGLTPLHLAARHDRVAPARALIGSSANVRAKDVDGWTALHHACRAGATNVARLLIESGARVGARDRRRATPLFWAAFAGHAPEVELLHGAGASLAVNVGGYTPLRIARRRGHDAVVALLLRLGAEA